LLPKCCSFQGFILPKSSSLSENCLNLVPKLTFEYGYMLEALVSGKVQICLCCGGSMQAAALYFIEDLAIGIDGLLYGAYMLYLLSLYIST
jgi:hypothetical protein